MDARRSPAKALASVLLRRLLLWLAQIHMVLALVVTVLDGSNHVSWVCNHKRGLLCAPSSSLWELQSAYPESIAYTVQGFYVLAASLNFASVFLGSTKKHREATAVLFAVTFAVGSLPWALVLGFENQSKGRVHTGLYVAIGVTLLHLVSAVAALVAIYVPDNKLAFLEDGDEEEDADEESTKRPLLPHGVARKKNKLHHLTIALNVFAGFALLAAIVSVAEFNVLGGRGSEFNATNGVLSAGAFLAFDVVLVNALVASELVPTKVGSIVSATLALAGSILGIAGSVLSAQIDGEDSGPVISAILSLISSLVVFGLGVYIATQSK